MSLAMSIFTFINVWCISLFAVMPFFIVSADKTTAQEYAAAPKSIRWKKAFKVNTLVALCITAGLALLIKSHIVSLT